MWVCGSCASLTHMPRGSVIGQPGPLMDTDTACPLGHWLVHQAGCGPPPGVRTKMAEKPAPWLEDLKSLARLKPEGCLNPILSPSLLRSPSVKPQTPSLPWKVESVLFLLGPRSPFGAAAGLSWGCGQVEGWCVGLRASHQLHDLGHPVQWLLYDCHNLPHPPKSTIFSGKEGIWFIGSVTPAPVHAVLS